MKNVTVLHRLRRNSESDVLIGQGKACRQIEGYYRRRRKYGSMSPEIIREFKGGLFVYREPPPSKPGNPYSQKRESMGFLLCEIYPFGDYVGQIPCYHLIITLTLSRPSPSSVLPVDSSG